MPLEKLSENEIIELNQLEKLASDSGFLLRIKVRKPLGIWAVKVVIAEKTVLGKIQIWGEMKAWAYRGYNGLQLDTMRVHPDAPYGIGDFIWCATMAWALEETPCRKARLLAICDSEKKHYALTRYFRRRGFISVKEVGSSLLDLPIRMVWGGSGNLMVGRCSEVFNYSYLRLLAIPK
ncbi:hypothetical protein [Prochlorococcus sp. MIT 1300]|uniref:hypothetical protein n=1 Tax=Prochlorococcus sp. MIT 1300 TaxID=3096218 RepID=UPI002A75FE8A|nr:hypothetical protein [Prochlorococcus sp. MIT 1300]